MIEVQQVANDFFSFDQSLFCGWKFHPDLIDNLTSVVPAIRAFVPD